MALRKEPERRYGSVEEFRQDIERHLEGFPVRASHGTAVYRIRKFVLRRRWGVAVSALTVLGAIGTSAAIWWQGQQAELRFHLVRQLAHAVVFDVHDSIENLPGSTAARKLLVERALAYLTHLEATRPESRDVRLDLARAYEKVASIQDDAFRGHMGNCAGALENYSRAREMLQPLVSEAPGDTEALDRQAYRAPAGIPPAAGGKPVDAARGRSKAPSGRPTTFGSAFPQACESLLDRLEVSGDISRTGA